MYSLVEIAHIRAAKAAFNVQLETLKAKHKEELKAAYKAGREDLIKELGIVLDKSKTKEIDDSCIINSEQDRSKPFEAGGDDEKLEDVQVLDDTDDFQQISGDKSESVSDSDNFELEPPRVGKISQTERKKYNIDYKKIYNLLHKRRARMHMLTKQPHTTEKANTIKSLAVEIKKYESILANMRANWAERRRQSEQIEEQTSSQSANKPSATVKSIEINKKGTNDKILTGQGLSIKQKRDRRLKTHSLYKRIWYRRITLSRWKAQGKQATPEFEKFTNELVQLEAERAKLMVDLDNQSQTSQHDEQLSQEPHTRKPPYPTRTSTPRVVPSSASQPPLSSKTQPTIAASLQQTCTVGDITRKILRTLPEFTKSDFKQRKVLYKRWYNRVTRAKVRGDDITKFTTAGYEHEMIIKPKIKLKPNFRSNPEPQSKSIRELKALDDAYVKKKLEDKRAKQRIYDQKRSARKRELRDLERAKALSQRDSQSVPTPGKRMNCGLSRTNDSTLEKTSQFLNTDDSDSSEIQRTSEPRPSHSYPSPPTFDMTMNRHQSIIDEGIRRYQPQQNASQSIRNLELQTQDISRVSYTIANNNTQNSDGLANLARLEQELQRPIPIIKSEPN